MKSLVTSRVNLMVRSVSSALVFYRDMLGLKVLAEYGEHYAEVQSPDLLIGLHPKSDSTYYGNNMSIGFGVTAFDEAVKELKGLGIEIRIEQDGWVRLAYFTDPDGNELFLAERKEN